jgi:hypothetical protein
MKPTPRSDRAQRPALAAEPMKPLDDAALKRAVGGTMPSIENRSDG